MPKHDPSEKTKSEILTTAVRLFWEHGLDRVNIEDIVKEVGVTRGAFYHYFKSREALVSAVVDKIHLDNNPFVLAQKAEGLNALEKFRLAINISIDFNEDKAVIVHEIRKAIDNPIFFKSDFLSQMNVLTPFLEELLIEGNKDGSMSTPYPKQAAQAITLLFGTWISPLLFPVSDKEFEDKVSFLELFSNLIGVPVIDSQLKERFLKTD